MTATLGRLNPQGAPRGLLVHWMLRRISKSPTYGFEILREIENKTEGSWRPGPGSVYPLLRRLEKVGFVKAEEGRGEHDDQRLYRITTKGRRHLEETREMLRTMGKRWVSLRGIFVDLIDAGAVPDFIMEGSRKQFELARQIVEANRQGIPATDFRAMLREYSFLLASQQEWASRQFPMVAKERSREV